MDYFKIIKRAAEITWKHKSTWLFGVLTAIFQGRSGFNYNFNSGNNVDFQAFPNRYQDIVEALLSPLVLIVVALSVLILIVLSIFLGFSARAALIGMVRDVEIDGRTSIGRGFRWGWRNWLALFGLNLAVYIPFTVFAVLVTLLLIAPAITGFAFEKVALGVVLLILGILLLLVLLIPVGLALALLTTLAERFRVIEGLRVFAGIKQGYRAVRKNLGTVLLFWLIMVIVGFALSIIFLPVTLLLLAPAAAFFFLDKLVLTLALGIPGVIIILFLSGLLQVFTSAAWTEFFMELTGAIPEPAIPEISAFNTGSEPVQEV